MKIIKSVTQRSSEKSVITMALLTFVIFGKKEIATRSLSTDKPTAYRRLPVILPGSYWFTLAVGNFIVNYIDRKSETCRRLGKGVQGENVAVQVVDVHFLAPIALPVVEVGDKVLAVQSVHLNCGAVSRLEHYVLCPDVGAAEESYPCSGRALRSTEWYHFPCPSYCTSNCGANE